MDIDELEKKTDEIIKEKFNSDLIHVEAFSPKDSKLLMLIPYIEKRQILVEISHIKKSEMEVTGKEGVVFINLPFNIKNHRYISRVLDKLCLCCRNCYLLDGIKNMPESVKKENSISDDKFIPFILMPDLVLNLTKDMWNTIKDKEFTEINFNIIVMPFDILEENEDEHENVFGRHISVIDMTL